MCYMSLSVIAFSPALAKKTDEYKVEAVHKLQEYLGDNSSLWGTEDKIFQEALAWRPIVLDREFNPAAEKLHGQATVGQVKDIVKLGFTVFTPI